MRSVVSLMLVTILFTLSLATAHAKPQLLPTLDAVEGTTSIQDRQTLVNFMNSDKVQKELVKLGVNPEEAVNRVATLSDAEVRSLSQQIEKAQAGGDGVGTLIGVALFVFVLLLITDILGLTKVFPFTRSIR